MSKAQQYRDQSVENLEVLQEDLRKELFQLRNERRETGKMEKPHLLRAKKKEIARVLTIINEKKKHG